MQPEKQKSNEYWNPTFHEQFQGFNSLAGFLHTCWQDYSDFPQIDDYHQWQHAWSTQSRVQFVSQDKSMSFEERVYERHEVMTRANLWHDFFNNLTWIVWPRLKWAIMSRYYLAIKKTQNTPSRNRLQNFLAQLDECGLLIVTSNADYLKWVCEHQWRALFCQLSQQRSAIEVMLFGHGLLEKGLNPYIGMTGKALLLVVDNAYFQLNLRERIQFSDEIFSAFVTQCDSDLSPKQLQPFPVLGLPGWYDHGDMDKFVTQHGHYFRPKRNESVKCAVLNELLDKTLWGQWGFLHPLR